MNATGHIDVRSGEQLHSELVRRFSEAKAADKPTPAQFEQLRAAREKGQIDVPEVNPSSFAAIPPVICFQGSTDSVLLTLNNRDTAAHTVRLKANHTAAPWLLVTGKKKLGERIAQGMEAVISLRCTAIGKSASTLLVFNTDEGEVRIPVMVMGPRSQIQMPEEVAVGEVICKHTVNKRVVVENTGNAEATFALHTDGPFSVTPGYLGVAPGQFAEFTVSMCPSTYGKQSADLILMFEQGEIVGVPLYGQGTEAAAKLDTNELILDDNALGMTGSKVVTFRNWTASPLKFSWCRYCLPEMDQILDDEGTSHDLMDLMSGADRLGSEFRSSPKTLHESQMSGATVMLSRLANGINEGSGGMRRQPFESDTIRIDPMSGVIPPKSLFDFTVVFSPEVAQLHVETAYLDVEGFAGRIPMEIRGLATGAVFSSNTSVMDLGHIMVYERNNFEIELTNTSLIAGDFQLMFPHSKLTKDITVSPTKGRIEAGRMCLLQVSTRATRITEYDLTLVVAVINSACRVPLRVRATSAGPLLHFTPAALQFEPVGYGFSTKTEVTLTNTSHQVVLITLYLAKGRIEGDEVKRAEFKKAQRTAAKALRKAARAERRAARATRRAQAAAKAAEDKGDTEDARMAAVKESPMSDSGADSFGSESESDGEDAGAGKDEDGEVKAKATETEGATAKDNADKPTVPEDDEAESSGDEAVRNADALRTVKRNGKQVRVKRKYRAPFKVEETNVKFLGAYQSYTFWVKHRANCVGSQDDVCELLVGGIDGVQAHLPIHGLCATPDLRIADPVVDFGQVFLLAIYKKMVKIYNDSSIPASYYVTIEGLSSEYGQGPGRMDCKPATGVVKAKTAVEVEFEFEPFLTGAGKLVATVGCVGSDVRQEIQFLFNGNGPNISLSVPLTSEIKWGRIPLQKQIPKLITVRNESPVLARVNITSDPADEFYVDEPLVILPPDHSTKVLVIARLSIAKKRTAVLTIAVDRGSTFRLPMSAVGYGTALDIKLECALITPDQAARVTMKPTAKFKSGEKAVGIDTNAEIAAGIKVFVTKIADQYSLTEYEHIFKVCNTGWSPLECSVSTWGYAASRIHHMRMARLDDDGTVDKSKAAVVVPEEMLPVFRVEPDKFFLKPCGSSYVVLKGYSKSARYVQERLLFHTVVGKAKTKEKAMSLDVCCTFVRPLLRISHKVMTFEQVVPTGKKAQEQRQVLTLTNENDLEIVCTIAAYQPFGYYSPEGEKSRPEVEMHIPRNASYNLDIFFDPHFHKARSSKSITQSLSIIYRHHSQVDEVKLHGTVSFPNLQFDREAIDFGYPAWHTTKTECVFVRNDSELPVTYAWLLKDRTQRGGGGDGDSNDSNDADEGLGAEVPSSSDCGDDDDDDNGDDDDPPKPKPLSELALALARLDIQLVSSTDTTRERRAIRDPDREQASPDGGVESDHRPGERRSQQMSDAGGAAARPGSGGASELRADAVTPLSNLYVSQPALDSRSHLHEQPAEPFRNVPRPKAEPLKVFDVMPVFGIIEPGDTQVFAFDFTAKSRIVKECEAVCIVRGGPKYPVKLRGAASKIKYRLRSRDLNCGTLLFNVKHYPDYYIQNTGRGPFNFTIYQPEYMDTAKSCVISPTEGRVEPGEKFNIGVTIFPGLPEEGIAQFGIRVEHHRREEVTIRWNGQLCTLTLNIPRLVTDDYIRLARVAQKSLEKRGFPVSSQVIMVVLEELRHVGKRAYDYTTTCDLDKEQLRAALNTVREVLSGSPSLPVLSEKAATAPLLPIVQLQLDAEIDRLWTSEYHIRRVNKQSALPSLPEHGIDFGLVKVYEPLYTNFRADNASEYPVAFHLDQRQLTDTGFYLTSNRSREVRGRSHALIEVHYDPFRRLASKGRPKLSQAELERALVDRCGKFSAYVFLELPEQPSVAVRIQADLYIPLLDLSTDEIPFAKTKTGQCSVEVITICNLSPVAIHWQAVVERLKGPKLDKFLPLHLRQQALAEYTPKPVFSTVPQAGVLRSKEVQQVAVVFTPQEQKFIKQAIAFTVDGLESVVELKVSGKGLEPRLTFPAGTRTIGPVLPCDTMSSEFVIENPCSYAIEFVATQFDKQTRIEEKILNWDDTFDAINKMILPPREAGQGLPPELLQEYDEGLRKLHEEHKQAAEEMTGETSMLDISSTVALAESSSSLRGKSRTSTKGSARDPKEKEKKKEKKESKREKEVREAAEADAQAAMREAALAAERERAMSPMSRIKHRMASLSAEVMPPMEFLNASPLHYTQLLTDAHLGLRDAAPPSVRAVWRHLRVDGVDGVDGDGADVDAARRLRRSRGIAVVVHGAPSAGKTTQAERLATHFHARTIRIDDVLREAIDARDQFGGSRACEFLAQTRIHIVQEAQRELDALQQAAAGTGGGSRKTKQGGGGMNRSKPSASSLQPAGGGGGGRMSPGGGKAAPGDGAAPSALADLSEAIDPALVERATMNPEDIKVPLDEEIAVEILKHRLLRDEHYLGAVFDGLQTDILENMDASFRVIRRALGQRKFFHFFDLYCDQAGLGRRDWQRPFFEYTLYGEAVAVEPVEIPDWRTIDEDDYLALDEWNRRLIDARQLKAKQEVKRKRLEKEAEEKRIRELKEAEERRLEEERTQKKKKKFSKVVGVSPSVSSVTLAKGQRSRPSSGVKAKDSTHHLLVADSKASILDAGEAGRSKLLMPSRSRLESLSALAVDQMGGRTRQDAETAEEASSKSQYDEELPGFAEYYASRSSLTKVMAQWHEEKECFVVSDEKSAVAEQEAGVQPTQQPAHPPPRKQLARLKETETNILKSDTQPEEAGRERKKPPLTAVVIDVQLVRDMSKPKAEPGNGKVFNLSEDPAENDASADKQEASTGKSDEADDKKTTSRGKKAASDTKAGVSEENAGDGEAAPAPSSPVPAAPLPDSQPPPGVPTFPQNAVRRKPRRAPMRISLLSPVAEEVSPAAADMHLLMSEKQAMATDGEYRQAVAKKLGVPPDVVSVREVLENGESRVRPTGDGAGMLGAGTLGAGTLGAGTLGAGTLGAVSTRAGSASVPEAALDRETEAEGSLAGDGSQPRSSEVDLESLHQSEIQYKTVVQDVGQDADTVTQHLLSQMPKLAEVIEDIAVGPGNPKELPQATFQLITRTYTVDDHEEEIRCFSILPDAAPPPKPIEPKSEPFGSVPHTKESDKRSPSVSAKKGSGSTKSLKPTSGSTTASKKGSGRKSVARSPQPSKKSGRSSVASEDSTSAHPSTVSLDQVSLVSAEPSKPQPPLVTRWVVPANGSISLHVHFNSKVETVSDQVLNFEIVGTGRKYNLFCRGVATYPRLNPRPQIVWPKVIPQAPRNGPEPAGVFVEKENTYMFGALLVGKSHDRMREGRYPENMVKMKLVNTSGLPCIVNSSLEVDNTGQTFFVEPRDMVVPANGKATLSVMAFPKLIKENSLIEDILRITCCQNPQPLIYNLSCHSSKPLLEAEPKDFFFSRVPVGRPVTKSLKLFNRSLLPVGYRVTGLKIIGDEFKLQNDHGVINPGDSATVKLTLHSYRAFLLKKALRFEAYDVVNQDMGMIHSEGIPVGCEVYDVQVDISYPKSSSGNDDGELEFAPSRVYEEQKLTMHCRNKGKFAVAYQFHVDKHALPDPGLADAFCIIPHKGLLQAGDKATAVTVAFAPEREVELSRVPVIRCEILDPAKTGLEDSLAFVPCKVSAKVVYSKYAVQPATDLNFGTMILQTRRERKFTLVNTGDFEFRFTLMRRDGLVTPMAAAGNLKRRQVVEGNVEKNRRVKDSISKAAQGKKDLNNSMDMNKSNDEAILVRRGTKPYRRRGSLPLPLLKPKALSPISEKSNESERGDRPGVEEAEQTDEKEAKPSEPGTVRGRKAGLGARPPSPRPIVKPTAEVDERKSRKLQRQVSIRRQSSSDDQPPSDQDKSTDKPKLERKASFPILPDEDESAIPLKRQSSKENLKRQASTEKKADGADGGRKQHDLQRQPSIEKPSDSKDDKQTKGKLTKQPSTEKTVDADGGKKKRDLLRQSSTDKLVDGKGAKPGIDRQSSSEDLEDGRIARQGRKGLAKRVSFDRLPVIREPDDEGSQQPNAGKPKPDDSKPDDKRPLLKRKSSGILFVPEAAQQSGDKELGDKKARRPSLPAQSSTELSDEEEFNVKRLKKRRNSFSKQASIDKLSVDGDKGPEKKKLSRTVLAELFKRGNSKTSFDSDDSPSNHAKQPSEVQRIFQKFMRPDGITGQGSNSRLSIASFTCCPAMGSIGPGQQVVINVECHADSAARTEVVGIDVSDRAPSDHPEGFPYKLIMEACTPGVDTALREIFEEHTIVPSLAHITSADLQRVYTGQGTLCEDERQFLFHSVFVGTQAKALFKLSNKTKLPCDVHISIKGQNAKASIKLSDIFSVSPSRFSLDGKDMKLITVTFSPQAIQSYSCTFDIAVVDPAVVTSSVASRGPKSQCQFEVSGEGSLPRLSLVTPKTALAGGGGAKKAAAEATAAQALLEFARLLPRRCSVRAALVMNHSPFPVDVEVRLAEDAAAAGDDGRPVCFAFAAADAAEFADAPDPDAARPADADAEARARVDVPARLSARTVTPFHSTALQHALLAPAAAADRDGGGGRRRALVRVRVAAERTLRVAIKCAPKAEGPCRAELQVMAVGNHFETIRVRLVGEGYRDSVQVAGLAEVTSCHLTMAGAIAGAIAGATADGDHCPRTVKRSTKLKSASRVAAEESGRCWHVDFGGTEVGVKKSLQFTMTNHDTRSVLKFSFMMPATDRSVTLSFVPQFGHIGPGCSKTIHATVVSISPVTVQRLCFHCSTCRILYITPPDAESLEAKDWDEQSVVSRIVESIPVGHDQTLEQPKQILQLEEEPEHTVLGAERNLPFAASMTCAYAEYTCPQATPVEGKAPVLEFRDTAFYQARDATITLTNTGMVALRYSWSAVAEPAADLRTASQLSIPMDLFDALLLPLRRRQHLPAFFIEPNEGTVPVGETVNFKITFRPILPGKSAMKLQCRIANLTPKLQQPSVALEGVGVVPIAHIDLPPSDYLTGARRATELKTEPDHTLPAGAQLQINTKVLEFTSHAVQPVVREFFVANPTAHPWKYMWEMNPITPRDAEVAFRFATNEGDIEPGQRARVLVEFRASNIRFLESFWNFTIPSQQLSIPFLLVGRMEDPSVTLSTTVINFGSTLTGRKVKRTLEICNDEDSFVEFTFSDPARKVDSHTASVVVNPRQGKVPPNSKKPIDIEMLLYMEKELSFNISCKVKGMLKTLPVNIKADGYAVHVEGSLEAPTADGKTEVKSLELEPSRNVVDFGKVQVNEKVVRTVSVYNAGRFPAVYRWRLSENCDAAGGVAPADVHSGKGQKRLVTLRPGTKGAIEPASSQKFTFVFCPGQKKVLAACEAVCQMAYGPSLRFVFAGEGVKPSLHFSFTKYSFGPCFAGRPVESCQYKALTITNNHSQAVSLKSLLSSNENVSVLFKACVVQPGRSKDAVFQFHPAAVGKVAVDCQFEVNGLSTFGVKISGEGTIMKVEVADPEQRQIKLNTIQALHTCSQPVKLVNRSSAPITFDVGLSPRATLEPGVLAIKPHSDILLGPGASGTVVVTFSPTCRMPRFSEEIIMDCSGSILPLFTVSAACIAREVSLDFRRLAFGDVVLGSATSRRVTMKNSGDLATRYLWDAAKFGPDFTIWPVEGVIEAGLEVQFTIAFKPVNLSKDIRYEDLKCRLENAEALPLNLTGACVQRSTAREPIMFLCHVRSKDVKTIQIKNPSTQSWTLRPVIEGHYWSGADTVTVEPLSTKQYEVVYRPIAMATDKKHQGSAFIALPDGNAIYYVFTGATQEAKIISATSREWPCKKEHVEVFTLSNWLKTPQRFMVKIDTLKPDKPDPSTSIKGLEYVDVPASGKASYQLKFRAHREGTTLMKITFRNPDTKESMVYTLSVKSTAAESMETIKLCTPVRQGLPHLLVVSNPLDCPVVFSTAISCNEISLPQQFTVPGKSDGECTLQYLPLKVGRSSAKLTFSSHDLGSYVYELEMEASLAPPEQALYFRAPLGEKLVQTCDFTNYARTKTEYLCKVDNPNFLVERSISALAAVPGGTALSTDVAFEPQWLGSSTGTLTVASNTGGEYQFPIRGTCLQPKPQGPIVVKGHSAATIQFKNVFAKAARFHFSVDNAAFSLRSATDTIRSRKIYYVMVSCEGNHPAGGGSGGASAGGGGSSGGGGGGTTSAMQQRGGHGGTSVPGPAATGTLTVTCTAESLREAELPCAEDIRWIYYLRGAP